MWSNLAKLSAPRKLVSSSSSTSASKPDNKLKGKAVAAPKEDPISSFVSNWTSLEAFLSMGSRTPLALSPVPRQLGQLYVLLSNELSSAEGSDGALGPCLEFMLKNHVLSSLVKLSHKDDPPGIRCEVLRWLIKASMELDESFLVHSAVHRPIVRLLRDCLDGLEPLTSSEEEAAVELMAAISERIHASTKLLAVFFREHPVPKTTKKDLSASLAAALNSSGPPILTFSRIDDDSSPRPSSPTFSESTVASSSHSHSHSSQQPSSSGQPRKKSEHDFLLFAYLLRFVHREGHVGDLARTSLRTLAEVAMLFPPVTLSLPQHPDSSTNTHLPPRGAREATLALAEYLLDSDFAEVLGAGLGALYSLLPGKLLVRPVGVAISSPKPPSTAWDDEAPDSSASGMVLGGMGPLGDEDDPEEIQIKREEEELRLRALGVGVTDSSDFRGGLDGWLKLVEFIQDVLRIAHSVGSAEDSYQDDAVDDDDARQQRLMASALSSSISGSVRSLFLENVLYPSILECSEGDGSAVAVMSYLDALLEVLEEGSALESTVLGYLMGEEDVSDLEKRTKATEALLSASLSPRRLQRKKSNALILIESSSARSQKDDYFTSLGRFSLKDLLVTNVHSTSSATATAAIKLLQTLLTGHDRWSMGLLDAVLNEGATSFPVVLRQPPLPAPLFGLDESDEEEDSDSDVFVYRDLSESQLTPRPSGFVTSTPTRATSGLPLLLGAPLPSTPSINVRLDSLNALLAIVGSIDPSYRSSRAVGGGSEISSTKFANYLRDAEAALAADLGFRRGLGAAPDIAREEPPLSPQARRRSKLFGATPQLSPRDFANAKTGYRHQLEPDSQLLSLLLESLSHFFSHPPDLNLALTGVLSSLALCPYRSLDGWLLPPSSSASNRRGENELSRLLARNSSASDDGDDRSIDFEIEELGRVDTITSPSKTYTPSPLPPSRTTKADRDSPISMFSILSALADSVSHYRLIIPNFDKYLSERRDGLMFVDNLADALDIGMDVDGGNAFADAVKSLPMDRPTSPPPPPLPLSKHRKTNSISAHPTVAKFGAFLSPRSPASSHLDAFSTPPPRTQPPRPESSSLSVSGDAASPFAAHYRQTGSISVKPIIVKSPNSTFHYDGRDGEGEDEEDGDGDESMTNPPDTPTRRLSPFVLPGSTKSTIKTSPSVLSDDATSDASPSNANTSSELKKKRELQVVTLSTVLDDVILLEEFIKELAGVICVRRSLGIDGVRYLD